MMKLVLAATAVATLAFAPAFAQNTTGEGATSTATHTTHKAKKKHVKHSAASHSANEAGNNAQ